MILPLTVVIYVVVDTPSVNQIIQFRRCLFFIKNIIFHLFEAGNWVTNSSFKWMKNIHKQFSSTMVKLYCDPQLPSGWRLPIYICFTWDQTIANLDYPTDSKFFMAVSKKKRTSLHNLFVSARQFFQKITKKVPPRVPGWVLALATLPNAKIFDCG